MLKDQQGPSEDKPSADAVPSPAASSRRISRGKQAAIGVAGLAVIGGGAFAVTGASNGADSRPAVTDMGGLTANGRAHAEPVAAHAVPNAGAQAVPGAQTAPKAAAGTPAQSSPAPGVVPKAPHETGGTEAKQQQADERRAPVISDELAQKAQEAREANRRLGTEVRKAPARQLAAKPVDRSKVRVTRTGRTGSTLQVSSAKADLTGYGELSIVDGKGRKAGKVQCSQRFRFSEDAPAVEKPTLLVCWRLSATKSVYTVAVSVKGRPSQAESVAAINREWKRLN